MAPKRLLEDPPAASSMEEDSDAETVDEEEEEEQDDVVEAENGKEKSGDEEDEEEEEEDEEDDDEEDNVNGKEKEKSPAKNPLVTSSSAVPNPQSESASSEEDEDDAGSETESDDINHSPSASDFTVKPIVSKPMNDSVKPNKKNAPAKPSSVNPGSKRPAESDLNLRDSKKKKGTNSGDDEDTKKGRLWSGDDEIAILKGMIDYKAKKGSDPYTNMGPFHEFLKKSLKVDVSKNQLMDKIRRLRKKYHTNAEKGENGEDPVFSKAHELKSFDLSKKIWGLEADGGDDNAKNSKKKQPRKSSKANNSSTVLALPVSDVADKNVDKKEGLNVANGGVKAEPDEFWSKYPCLSASLRFGNCSPRSEDLERLMIQRMPSIGSSKAKELDDRWRKLQVLEMELSVKKLDVMHEQAKLVLNVMKSQKD